MCDGTEHVMLFFGRYAALPDRRHNQRMGSACGKGAMDARKFSDEECRLRKLLGADLPW